MLRSAPGPDRPNSRDTHPAVLALLLQAGAGRPRPWRCSSPAWR
ncbi:hypothetical protein ACFPM0_24635 [Pseudonocardia sulfidoxydans]